MDTKKLRRKILDLAIHGKLVPQDPNDEPASVLLERIRAEKERLISEGKIKRSKKSATSDTSHYEDVPFEVPEGWCWCRLDCVGEIVTGSTPSKDNVDYYGGSIPFYKPTDLEQGINTIEASDSLTELGFSVSRQLPEQSILVTCIGATIGKTGLIQKRGTCNQQINAIISNNMVLPEYLYYTCISGYMQSEIIGRASATTLPIINKNKFSEIPIPVPPIQEQQRIISKIETLFSFVIELGNSEKELISTISKAKSKILDLAIHGKLVPQDPNDEPASELLKRINPKAVTSCDNPHYEQIPEGWVMLKGKYLFDSMKSTKPTGELFKYIDIDSIDNKRGVVTSPKMLSSSNAPSRASRYTCQGDVLFSMVRPYLQNIAIVQENDCIASTGFFVCHPIPIMTAEFCYYLMKSSYIVDGLNQFMKGDNSPSINNANITDWIYPIPPIEEQNRIVQKIKALYGTIDSITEALQ